VNCCTIAAGVVSLAAGTGHQPAAPAIHRSTPGPCTIFLLGHDEVQATRTPFDFVHWRVKETTGRLLLLHLAQL